MTAFQSLHFDAYRERLAAGDRLTETEQRHFERLCALSEAEHENTPPPFAHYED